MKDIRTTLIFIPTYNERENVEPLFDEIMRSGLEVDVLFLDDNSPDGTGQILDDLAAKNGRIHVIHRSGRLGIGSAHLEGIAWAYRHQYTSLITMDADFSHPPKYLPDFIRASRDHDIVVGSRYVLRESLNEWNLFRKSLTRLGHFATKYFLNMPYDATGAYRLYRLDRIPREVFGVIQSKGYSFFFESLYELHSNRFSIKEVPITLPARTYGHSKMSLKEAAHSVRRLFHLLMIVKGRRGDQNSRSMRKQVVNIGSAPEDIAWDDYWRDHKNTSGRMYDRVAAFYRKYIIKRTLNHFVGRHFSEGAKVVHAGCGSGQVDTDISRTISITAVDMSIPALHMYRALHKDSSAICGDILGFPVKDQVVDGIYNLGVMEHFAEPEIDAILQEFHRILKPNGKILIFWPPEYGASVIFLKAVHYILNNIFKNGRKFHPDEITRVQSKQHVTSIVERNSFRVAEYYFGIRDCFTYAIIAAVKEERGGASVSKDFGIMSRDGALIWEASTKKSR